jgi:hypothetical protein
MMNNSFEEWMEEMQGFLTREDRLYSEFDVDQRTRERIRIWLEAAWQSGWDAGHDYEE